MNLIDLRGLSAQQAAATELPRPEIDATAAVEVVRPLLDSVQHRGAAALYELDEKFDGVRPASLRVPQAALDQALGELDPRLREALEVSIAHARQAHEAQLPLDAATEILPGGMVYQRWVPLRRVGLYVPGGLAVYPSSVVMNVVTAQVAGVDSIVVASPPQADFDGLPHPSILAACALLGVDEVIAVGGAQAIGAMAYGFTDGSYDCAPVDKVAGPGNIYVAAAKRVVSEVCGIDAEAGTTEIAILADVLAPPQFVAADLISQAEHDPAAASVLVTDSPELVDAVQQELALQVPAAYHSERIATALNGPQSAIVLTETIAAAEAVIEAYAPEHLEVICADQSERAFRIRNAGAIFVGPYSPVPLGDYIAGSNHVLPTGGTARYASGLNVTQYLRSVQVIEYDAAALADVSEPLLTLAGAEGLSAHGFAAAVRGELGAQVAGSPGTAPRVAPIQLPLRPELAAVEPYGAPQLDVPVRLNVNENPYPPSDAVAQSVAEAVAQAMTRLNRYADRDALGLRAALARYLRQESGVELQPAQVWAANGSNEVMLQLLQAFGGPGRVALAAGPTYSMYEEYARDTNTDFVLLPPTADDLFPAFDADRIIAAMVEHRPAVLFLPTPNNPSGTPISQADLAAILAAAETTGPIVNGRPSATLVLADEAYAEFRDPGVPSALQLLGANPHLVVTRTMSKAFAAAGLRLGYLAATPAIVDEVQKVRLPYHLSLVTQAAALAALEHAETQLAQVDELRAEREKLAVWLTEQGYQVAPSASNFLLFGQLADRRAVWQSLVDQGVLVRVVGPEGCLRVTVGTPAENEAFRLALTAATKEIA